MTAPGDHGELNLTGQHEDIKLGFKLMVSIVAFRTSDTVILPWNGIPRQGFAPCDTFRHAFFVAFRVIRN